MNFKNLLLLSAVFCSMSLQAKKNDASLQTRGIATQMINTGVSLNQQISSSSLNSATAATLDAAVAQSGMFAIAKSGRYFLSTDLFAAPGGTNTPVILINASDVVLDLGGKSITLSTTIANGRTCRAAIEIKAGARNITIMNGTINGYATNNNGAGRIDKGILYAHASTINTNMIIDNVTIVGCLSAAIDLKYINGLRINDVQTYGTIDGSLSPIGLSLANCNQGQITNSAFNGCYSTSAAVTGIVASACNNFTLENVEASNNVSTFAAATGVSLTNCTGFKCNNVMAFKNSTTSETTPVAKGIFLTASTGNSFSYCITTSNVCARSVPAGAAYGFRLENASDGNNFINCESSKNASAGGAAGEAAGFSNFNCGYNLFSECTANNNNANNASAAATLAYGFMSTGTGNMFKACKATGNIVASNDASAAAHGIGLLGERAGVIQNCEISANNATTEGAFAYGIRMRGSCVRCTVEYNKILANLAATHLTQYGFKDAAADSTTFLRGNISFGHGKVFAGGEAYLSTSSTAMNYYLDYSESSDAMNIQMLIKEGDISNMNAFEAGSSTWFNFSVLQDGISG